MSNLKPAPIQLTPQVTRGCLGIGHPNRMAELDVKTLDQIVVEAKAARQAKAVAMPSPAPKTGFMVVNAAGEISAPMTAQTFVNRDEAGIGFWRIRAKAKSQQVSAQGVAQESQSSEAPLLSTSKPAALVNPIQPATSDVSRKEPSAKTRRVAASEPVVGINAAGSGVIIGIDMAQNPDVSVETDFVDGKIANMRVCAPAQDAGKPAKLDAFAARIIEIHGMAKPSASNTGQPRRLVSGSSL